MKLSQIISAGYQPDYFEKSLVTSYKVNPVYNTLILSTEDGTKHVSLDCEHSDLEIQFILIAKFNENTASAMLLADAAPVERKDMLPNFIRERANQSRINERMRERHGRSEFPRQLF